MRKASFLFVMIIIVSCNSSDPVKQNLSEEITTLSTIEAQSNYLEAIFDLDQKVRTDEDSVLLTYGHGSKEYDEHWNLIRETDLLNLKKIELFMATYGHPKKGKHSEKALGTPWIVIHHQSHIEPRRENFHYLYDAYKAGDLDGGAFAFYLNRFYKHEFGNRLALTSPFTEEIEIDTLIKSLGFSEQGISK